MKQKNKKKISLLIEAVSIFARYFFHLLHVHFSCRYFIDSILFIAFFSVLSKSLIYAVWWEYLSLHLSSSHRIQNVDFFFIKS